MVSARISASVRRVKSTNGRQSISITIHKPGQTLNGRPTPPAYNKRGIIFYIRKGTWGGGAYYLGDACCMRGNTVFEVKRCKIKTLVLSRSAQAAKLKKT